MVFDPRKRQKRGREKTWFLVDEKENEGHFGGYLAQEKGVVCMVVFQQFGVFFFFEILIAFCD